MKNITILTQENLREIYANHSQQHLLELQNDFVSAGDVWNLDKEAAFTILKDFIEHMISVQENPKELAEVILENELHLYGVCSNRSFEKRPDAILIETESIDGQNTTFIKVFDANQKEDCEAWAAWHGA